MAKASSDWGLNFMALCPLFVDTPLLGKPLGPCPQVPKQAPAVQFEGEDIGPEVLIT